MLGQRANTVVFKEPSIRTTAGLRKPDIVTYDQERAAVLNVQITTDSAAFTLEAARRLKVDYYLTPDVVTWVWEVSGHEPVFSSVTINWRETMATGSYNMLKDRGLINDQIELLTVRSLEDSVMILDSHHNVGACHGA